MNNVQREIIVDIDGTIADCSHRRHHICNPNKNWDDFFKDMVHDLPIKPVIDLVRELQYAAYDVLFVTGRPEQYRKETKNWLIQNTLIPTYLFMRPEKDFRPDHIVKKEILDNLRLQGFNPKLAIDDRQCVVDMWRSEGLICLQNKDEIFK